jgi:hypothetical protein
MLRIRRNGQACRTRAFGRSDAHPSIEGDDTGGIREQRVDVELSDLGVIGGKLAEADQHVNDSLDVRRWLSAISLQQLPDPGAGHQPARQQPIQRR